jgi:hypothetical protein
VRVTATADARSKAREIAGALVEQAIELAFEGGWRPKPAHPDDQAVEILKRGFPLLLKDIVACKECGDDSELVLKGGGIF